MRPTDAQVQRSLDALHDETAPEPTPLDRCQDDVPEGFLDSLSSLPAMREDRLEEVRRAMVEGEQPTADELAERMVGRMVCDRLR